MTNAFVDFVPTDNFVGLFQEPIRLPLSQQMLLTLLNRVTWLCSIQQRLSAIITKKKCEIYTAITLFGKTMSKPLRFSVMIAAVTLNLHGHIPVCVWRMSKIWLLVWLQMIFYTWRPFHYLTNLKYNPPSTTALHLFRTGPFAIDNLMVIFPRNRPPPALISSFRCRNKNIRTNRSQRGFYANTSIHRNSLLVCLTSDLQTSLVQVQSKYLFVFCSSCTVSTVHWHYRWFVIGLSFVYRFGRTDEDANFSRF